MDDEILSPTFNSAGFYALGNLIDDGEAYKYEYDAFGRLRKIRNQNDDLVAEFVYHGARALS